jgi:hypothetical protein
MDTPAPTRSPLVRCFWRLLQTLRDVLMALRRRFDGLAAVWGAVHRMRFSLVFASVACLALLTDQGQEILVNSIADPLRGSIFVASCVLASISVWYSSRLLFYTWKPDDRGGPRALIWQRRLVEWLPRLLGASSMFIPGVALWPVSVRMSGAMTDAAQGYAAVLIALAASFVAILWQRRRVLRHAPTRVGLDYRELSPWTGRFFLLMLALNVLAWIVFAAKPLWPLHLGVGPGVVVMLAAGLAIVTGSLIAHLADETRLPLLGALIAAAAVFSLWNDNHEIRLIAAPEQAPAPPLRTLDAYLDDKLAERVAAHARACPDINPQTERRPECRPLPFVVVAAEGGGVRAAAWTALVLSRIDDALARTSGALRLTESTVAISGVSGGSLGGALYLSAVRESREGLWDRQRRFFRTDLLTPMLGNMLFVDTPQRFFPYPIGRGRLPDRGRTFELAMEDGWGQVVDVDAKHGAFAQPFEDLWTSSHETLPLLLANTTVVGTGERMVQSPVLLDPAAASMPTLLKRAAAAEAAGEPQQAVPMQVGIQRRDGAFLGAYDGNACLLPAGGRQVPGGRYRAPLSGVVHNSARFTWFSPAGRFGDHSACAGVRVVDGGYFDNSGTATADDIVHAVRNRFGERVRPVIVHIRNDPAPTGKVRFGCDAPTPMPSPGREAARRVMLSEVFDPLVALIMGREARSEQARMAVKRRICESGGEFIEFPLTRERGERVKFPLHWTIAEDTLARMEAQFEADRNGSPRPNRDALRRLVETLTPPVPEAAPGQDASER